MCEIQTHKGKTKSSVSSKDTSSQSSKTLFDHMCDVVWDVGTEYTSDTSIQRPIYEGKFASSY